MQNGGSNQPPFFMQHTYESCAEVALTFAAKKDFKKYAQPQFQWLYRNNLLDKACAHMDVLRRELGDDKVAQIASRYNNRCAFKSGDHSAYMAAWRRGILDQVCAHMVQIKQHHTNEKIAEIAKKYKSRSEFVRCNNGAYQTATKRGILDEVCAHMVDTRSIRRLSSAEILTIASKYKTRNDFKLGDFGAYTTAIRRGLIVEACAHMEYGAAGFREDKPAVLYHYRVVLPDGLVLYKIGITNRKPKQRLATMGLRRGVKAELIKVVEFALGRDARIAEKRIHRKLSSHRYGGPAVMLNGNTELFTVNALEY